MRALRLRFLALALTLGVGALMSPRALHAQATAARFEIAEVADSTFTFDVGDQRWVARGQKGIAVDPRRRDALVARFRVIQLVGTTATALVTGETTRLTEQHVALLEPPHRAWWRNAPLWGAAAVGLAVGFALGKI